MILHLISKSDWDAQPANEPVRAKSLESEGFIHCTSGDDLMLQVANTFYKDQPGDFLVLEIDETKVMAEVKWEPPAPMAGEPARLDAGQPQAADVLPPEVKAEFGDQPASVSPEPAEAPAASAPPTLFPHIYGPLNRDAIVGMRKLVRAADGSFTGYAPVEQKPAADADNPLNLKSPSHMAQELLDATDEFSESLKRFKDSVEARMEQIDEKIKKL
jgi:uncharacterized protein (DUF952 family)